MEIVNTQTLVHVATELVIIGGLSFWFQRKTSLLQEEITELKNRLSKYEEILEAQGKILAEHRNMLQDFIPNQRINNQNVYSRPINNQAMYDQRFMRQQSQNSAQEQQQQMNFYETNMKNTQYNNHNTTSREDIQEQVESEIEDLPEEELDALLDGELKDIIKGRDIKSKDPDTIEIECTEEGCQIRKPRKQGLKKKKREKIRKERGN